MARNTTNLVKDIVDKGVHDGHGLVGDTGLGVHLLQHTVDERGEGLVVSLLGEEKKVNFIDNLASFTPILFICLLAGIAMWLSSRIANKLPESAIIVLEKLFGILLGALAIEFVASGVRSFLA